MLIIRELFSSERSVIYKNTKNFTDRTYLTILQIQLRRGQIQ